MAWLKSCNRIKKLYIVVAIVLVVLLLPVLYIGRYNHMAADDYAFGVFAHRALESTGSLWEMSKAAASYTGWVYNHWQGTYASVFLMSMQPGVFHEKAYMLTPFITIGFLILGFVYFIQAVCRFVFHSETYSSHIIALVGVGICIECVDIPVEAFYWFNGAVHYTVMQGLLLLMIGLLIASIYDTRPGYRRFAAAAILAVIVGGGNYMTAFSAILLEIVILLLQQVRGRFPSFYQKQVQNAKHGTIKALSILAISSVCLITNAAAPGNSNRASLFEGYSVPETIYYSFVQAFSDIAKWIDLPLILLLALLFPVVIYMFCHSDFSFPYPVLFVIGSICLYSAQYAPTFYVMRNNGPYRLQDAEQYMFYLYLLLDYIYVLGHMNYAYSFRKTCVTHPIRYCVVLTVLLLFVISCQNYEDYTTLSALHTMTVNEAQLYHHYMCQRELQLKDSSTEGEDLVLEPVHIRPRLLYYDDAGTNPADPFNTAIAEYYKKNSIVVK